MHWTNFIPLAVFAWTGRVMGATDEAWQYAFYFGSILAIIQLTYLYVRGIKPDYIALGANFFLIYGACGFLFNKVFLLPFLLLDEAIIFLFVLLSGIIASIFDHTGFIQMHADRVTVRSADTLLLIATSFVLLTSYLLLTLYKMSTFIAVAIPFIALLFFRKMLHSYYKKQNSLRAQ